MTSAINPDNPVHGNPTTQSVRDNFEIAQQEITNLQTLVAALMLNMPYMPLAGSTMTGSLKLVADPAVDSEAATKHYVDVALAVLSDRMETAENNIIDLQTRTTAAEANIVDLQSRVTALETPPPL